MAEDQPARLRQRKVFRPRKNILGVYSDTELIKRFRLDREGISFLTEIMQEQLESPTGRSMAITPEMKVLVTLCYLASGKMQMCNSDDFGISQPSVSKVITQTVSALSSQNMLRRFIKLPNEPRDIKKKQSEFMEIAQFPGIVGVIDSTHIRIIAPKESDAAYVNRDHFHSINVQLVFDANCRILNVVANWPGSTHDAQILDKSGLKCFFERNPLPAACHLLGDNDYPFKRWLLTPYLQPQSNNEDAYNRSHKETSSVVKRGIYQLKRKFPVLHDVRVNPQKACKIILACAVLHNICKERNIPDPEEDDNDFQMEEDFNLASRESAAYEGFRYRASLTNKYFNEEK